MFIFRQGTMTPSCRPMYRFSATDRFGHSVISWYTVLIPSFCASWGEWMVTLPGMPSSSIVPSSFEYTPVSTLIRVDLPAPFSPISA